MGLLIAPDKKLTVVLRLFAAGESCECCQYQFWIHCTTIGRFVSLPWKNIYNCLKEKYLKIPRTDKELNSIADMNSDCWQFLNAVGRMDEKHVYLFHPNGSGSKYHNYIGFFSLVMLVLNDYD